MTVRSVFENLEVFHHACRESTDWRLALRPRHVALFAVGAVLAQRDYAKAWCHERRTKLAQLNLILSLWTSFTLIIVGVALGSPYSVFYRDESFAERADLVISCLALASIAWISEAFWQCSRAGYLEYLQWGTTGRPSVTVLAIEPPSPPIA